MQIIAMGFAAIILAGTFLLMLPISSRTGEWTGFVDAFFTATSATCVTGLVVVDTYTHWNLFGQFIILIMIQTGGLGFMSIGVMFALAIHRKIGLRERGLLSESVNALQLGGIVKMMKKILIGTFLVEGVGAIILSIRFAMDFGMVKGIYYGIFHSVSAFCNAGFDLMGVREQYSSLVSYSGDLVINLTIMALIVIGGIGFLVWDDITKNKWNIKGYHLHTKLVLWTSGVLLVGGTILYMIFEKDNLSKGMEPLEMILTSMFNSVTPRTAGFNTTDVAGLTDASKLLTMILMFIGGSPGSTAGGIKTTTFLVFLLYLRASIRRERGVNIFRKRIDSESIQKASAVVCINITLALTATLVICGIHQLDLSDVLIETISAISTVGMSAGITRDFGNIAKICIIILMYCGRVGSLSMALSFTAKKKTSPVEYPEEKILIG